MRASPGTPIQAQTRPRRSPADIAARHRPAPARPRLSCGALPVAAGKRAAPGRAITSVRALVVAPTRELAVQIRVDALGIGRHTGLSIGVVYGGVDTAGEARQSPMASKY
jgi:ATP-dependent RNA helicase RhlB